LIIYTLKNKQINVIMTNVYLFAYWQKK